MSTTDTTTTETDTEAHAEDHGSPTMYVQIFVILFVLTAMEVAASFVDIGQAFLPTLIGLMSLKFLLVASRFMHLRYDTVLYSRILYTGLGLAMFLYAVVLFVFSDAVIA
jgi:caa(3)-type oxidase subunit IV